MEDEWYSGDNTNTAAIAAVVPGASPPTAGVVGKGFGDSFTPPTSRSGMIGGQVRFLGMGHAALRWLWIVSEDIGLALVRLVVLYWI